MNHSNTTVNNLESVKIRYGAILGIIRELVDLHWETLLAGQKYIKMPHVCVTIFTRRFYADRLLPDRIRPVKKVNF